MAAKNSGKPGKSNYFAFENIDARRYTSDSDSSDCGIKHNWASTVMAGEIRRDKERFAALTREAEKKLVIGMLNPATRADCRRQLVERNVKLVYVLSKKYALIAPDFDELLQNGLYGLSVAVDRYDVAKADTARFSTYATFWIRKFMLKYLWYNSYDAHITRKSMSIDNFDPATVGGQSPADAGDGDGLSSKLEQYIANNTPDDYAPVSSAQQAEDDDRDKVAEAIYNFVASDQSMTDRDRKIFEMTNSGEKTSEIAKKLACTPSLVNFRRDLVYAKIRDMLSEKLGVRSASAVVR